MAVTVTYTWPVQGTVPPSVATMRKHQVEIAQVNFGDADTTALVTHNWQSPLSDYGTALFPMISWYAETVGTAGLPVVSFALTNSVAVTVTKAAGAGTGGTIVAEFWRLFSMER